MTELLRQRSRACLLTSALLVAATAATAQNRDSELTGYFGASAGQARLKLTNPSVPLAGNGCAAGATACDLRPIGGKLFVGQTFSPVWAMELAYYNTGSGRAEGPDGSFVLARTVMLDGLAASAVARLSFGSVFASARAGVALARLSRSDRLTNPANGTFGQGSDENTVVRPLLGLGAGYQINKRAALHLDWDRAEGVVNQSKERFRADMFTLGLSYRC